MVTDPYSVVDHSDLRARMDCRGSSKEAIESTSWHRLGYIRPGFVPILLSDGGCLAGRERSEDYLSR